jgi:hypothetical protein
MKIYLESVVLAAGGEAGEEPFDMALEAASVVQVVEWMRASHAQPLDRGNRTNLLRFSVRRNHRSVYDATRHLLGHGAAVGGAGTLTISTEGNYPVTYELKAAVLKKIHGIQEGTTTTHFYEIIGGNLSQ